MVYIFTVRCSSCATCSDLRFSPLLVSKFVGKLQDLSFVLVDIRYLLRTDAAS